MSDFHAGMSRDEIFSAFGEPEVRRVMEKRDPHVWGPIETFWSSVPMGSRVEIWSYQVSGGAVELYFLDGSPQVRATGFAPEDAVF